MSRSAKVLDVQVPARLVALVMLGEQKYVNIEAPDQVPGVVCFGCGATVQGLRSFKCHNWAYAFEDLQRVVRNVKLAICK